MVIPSWMHRLPGLIAALLLLWFAFRFFEWRNLYHPFRTIEMTPETVGLVYEDVEFVAEDGCRLHGWWIPHDHARGTVIILHGNAGNIGERVWMAADFNRLGLNVFLFDYRGYGKSKGWPGEKGIYRDARAAFEVVRARYDDAENIPVLLYGRSLGGAVAIQLAIDKKARGLIVESSFTSVPEMGALLYPAFPRWLCHDRFNSIRKITDIHIPLLVAHSRGDQLVPFQMGQRLFATANEPKEFVELTGDHNDSGWHTTPVYWSALSRFMDNLFGIVQ